MILKEHQTRKKKDFLKEKKSFGGEKKFFGGKKTLYEFISIILDVFFINSSFCDYLTFFQL